MLVGELDLRGREVTSHARGAGRSSRKVDLGVSSCFEIGRRQFAGAKSLYVSSNSSFFFFSSPYVIKVLC